MKLKRENFLKQPYEGGILYQYVCNDTNFFLYVKGEGKSREVSVFKGNVDDRQDNFVTNDSLEAWNKLEEYLTACEPEQTSSGGFKNPGQMPNILPLLAIKLNASTNKWVVTMFVVADKQQVSVFNTEIDYSAFPKPTPDSVFEVDWSNEEVPQLLKAEILMKKYDQIKFEEDASREVFLFIPKSIVEQGGEEGGNTEAGEEGGEGKGKGEGKEGKEGKGKGKGKGESKDEPGDDDGGTPSGEPGDEPGDDDGGTPSDETGQKSDKPGEPTDEPGKPSDSESDSDSGGQQRKKELNFSDTINKLSDSTETSQSALLNVFRGRNAMRNGVLFLQTNNFEKIKKDLGLPSGMSETQLTQEIINAK